MTSDSFILDRRVAKFMNIFPILTQNKFASNAVWFGYCRRFFLWFKLQTGRTQWNKIYLFMDNTLLSKRLIWPFDFQALTKNVLDWLYLLSASSLECIDEMENKNASFQ